LPADLTSAYHRDLPDRRDGFTRSLHTWNGLVLEARMAGVRVDDLGAGATYVRLSREAVTPNDFVALSQVLATDATEMQGRVAGYRSGRDQASTSRLSPRALLASPGQYPRLDRDALSH